MVDRPVYLDHNATTPLAPGVLEVMTRYLATGDRVLLNGHPLRRLPNTLNVSITATIGAHLLAKVPQVAASTGSACHDGSISSPVLAAMGLDADRTAGAIRLSLGRSTTEADISLAADLLATAARNMASHS
jgi:cysteine desulfurase